MLLAEDELALAQTYRLIGKVELGPAHFTTRLSHLTCASQKLYVHPVHLMKSNLLPHFCVSCDPFVLCTTHVLHHSHSSVKASMDALTVVLDAWLADNPWPRPLRTDLPALSVFERKGILDCFWFTAATQLASVQALTSFQAPSQAPFHETLRNKREALIAKFYGSNASGRTTFMSNGYPILQQYATWCDAEGLSYAMDSAAKAKRFLEIRLDASRRSWSARTEAGHKGRANSAAESAFNAYRQSVCHLTALSQWQGYGFDMVYTEEVQTLRLTLMADVKRSKSRVQDSAATSSLLTKRLDPDEWRSIIEGLWAGRMQQTFKTAAGQERAQMRALLMTSLNQAAGRRGGDLRNLDLRMFLWHALPDVRPVSAWAIGASLRAVKEDNLLEDREHLLGWMRSKDRPACPVGILAAYLVWMHDVGGTGGNNAPFLRVMKGDLVRPLTKTAPNATPEWWSLSLIGGRNANAAISGSTHTKLQHAAFDSGDVYGKKAITHIHRPTALGNLLEGGVVSTDAALYQGWVHGVWADTYAKASFKTIPMLKANGWDPRMDAFECWWEGQDDDIPAELKAAVFPGLDEVADIALTRRAHDRSAVEFTKVLKVLRRVFIEDSIVHQPRWPAFPAYDRHAIWTTPALYNVWQAYADAERGRILQRQREWQMRTQDPGIAAALIEQLKAAHTTQKELALALTAVAGPSTLAGPTSTQQAHPTLQGQVRDPPELQDPHARDLALTYARWADAPVVGGVTLYSVRDAYAAYLVEHKRIAWSKIFPKAKANAAKVRYYKMTPFLHYIDDTDAKDRHNTLTALQTIMEDAKIDGPNFIKQCFYTLCHPADAGDKAKKPPPISPQALAANMRLLGLRLPVGTGANALLMP